MSVIYTDRFQLLILQSTLFYSGKRSSRAAIDSCASNDSAAGICLTIFICLACKHYRMFIGVKCACLKIFIIVRPQIRRDYPLNLSILLSGGKETNKDSLSNGE